MKTGPLRFTSIKYRLALLFLSITAGAILVIYFYVVPQLESSLTSEKLDGLEKDAATYSRSLQQAIGSEINARQLDRLTRQIAEKTDAGVTVLGIPQDKLDPGNLGSSPPYVISDSREATSRLELSSNTTLSAARDRRLRTTTRAEGGSQLAQAAKPLLNRGEATQVVVFSESLNDVSDNVSLIQRQILIAGAIALLVSIIGGYGASNALARRVKRLERAAGEVAAGNFHEPPIPVDSEDELGQLARAFNEMQRRLAGLDRARKEFIANASHELRTPIFSLGGFVELLQDEDIDERTRAEFLVTMSEQVARLQKLTTELLDLSRLDAGSLELELEPVPLATIARQVAGEFAAAAARQEASIEIVGEEVEAECDPERVGQVVRALLDNALSHTGHGTSITVTTGRDETAGHRTAVLRVADDGQGIEGHRLPNVFDRFHSGDSGQGSGLGLAIARELTERMLGQLQVSSQPGKTVFTLTLPLAREQPPLPRKTRRLNHRKADRRADRKADRRADRARQEAGAHARMRRRSAVLATALTAIAAMALPACGGDSDSDKPPASAQTVERTKVEVVDGSGKGFDAAAVFRHVSDGVVTVTSLFGDTNASDILRGGGEGGQGTGFVLDGRGLIATNAHVVTSGSGGKIKNAKEVYVQFADGNQVPAKIVGVDPNSDVGLIRADVGGLDLVVLELGKSANVQVGQPVAAIGSPFGEEQSLSVGVVSATNRTIDALTDFQIGDAIQTDAAINRGNSGGPLLNSRGQVIGINSQIRSSGGGNEGVGFAVPVDTVKRSLAQLRAEGKARYGYIGVSSQALYPQLARHLDLPVKQGALVASVVKDGPAAKADIKGGSKEERFQASLVRPGGDLITKVDGRLVTREHDLSELISGRQPGDKITLEVYRGKDRRAVVVTLGERPTKVPN